MRITTDICWNRRCLALGVVATLLFFSLPARAWNDEGHMAVAYLAYQRLHPATRKRVDELLKLNPYYSKWLAAIPAGASPKDTKRMIFMIASTWADQIKGDPDYKDDGTNGGNTPAGPDASRNFGYGDHLRHKYWHFIDVPISQDGTRLRDAPSPNVQTQVAAFRAVLGSKQSDELKSYDLSWLEHLVGDVHQPLHAVARFSADLQAGDAGGNLIHLCKAPCNFTLHFFWDRLVSSQSSLEPPSGGSGAPAAVVGAELASARRIAQRLPAPDTRAAAIADEARWIQESVEAAKLHVYVSPIGPEAGPYTLTPKYFQAAKAVAQERVSLAGARLGNLLNTELK